MIPVHYYPLVLIIVLSLLVQRADADFPRWVQADNPNIRYIGDSEKNNTLPTWKNSFSTSCNTAEYVTEQVGDLLHFRFQGTSINVFGSKDTNGGVIKVNLDGTTDIITRTASNYLCFQPLFNKNGLEDTSHDLIMTLLESGSNGQEAGLLSIQLLMCVLVARFVLFWLKKYLYIRFTVPGQRYNDAAIIGTAVFTSICLVGAMVFKWFRSDHHKKLVMSRNDPIYYDPFDMPPFSKKKLYPNTGPISTLVSTTGDPPPESHIQHISSFSPST
ncbi:hypothetical protein FRC03_010210 [Tulasnella sp. 419]|nr:hypothetical protein FRC02_000280 [Tulasnella sp. 418]KAG8957378.1 hypothetical protein FRC03_010210 [Tulasnella sp. 419]